MHPAPLAEELRTSWLARVGAAYGVSPPQLCDLAWWTVRPLRGPHDIVALGADGLGRACYSPQCADLDDPLAGALVTALATVTGQPAARIAALGHGALAWPLATGRVQWCAQCLAGDTIPYLRQGWRDALTVCCPEHRRVLVDRCAACCAPFALPTSLVVWPVAGGLPNFSGPVASGAPTVAWLTCCPHCGTDRRRAADRSAWPEVTEPPASDWTRLVAFEAVRTRGHLLLPQPAGAPVWVDGRTYLDGIWTLIRCVRGPGLGSQRRRGVARRLGLPDFAMPSRGELRAWSVWVRHRVLRLVLTMLDDWPERFIALCHGPLARGKYRFGGPPGRAAPAWLTAIARPEVAWGRASRGWRERRAAASLVWPSARRTPPRCDERPWAAQVVAPDDGEDETGLWPTSPRRRVPLNFST